MPRKPIQIVSDGRTGLFALCDDGVIFESSLEGSEWLRLPPIPQDDDAEFQEVEPAPVQPRAPIYRFPGIGIIFYAIGNDAPTTRVESARTASELLQAGCTLVEAHSLADAERIVREKDTNPDIVERVMHYDGFSYRYLTDEIPF